MRKLIIILIVMILSATLISGIDFKKFQDHNCVTEVIMEGDYITITSTKIKTIYFPTNGKWTQENDFALNAYMHFLCVRENIAIANQQAKMQEQASKQSIYDSTSKGFGLPGVGVGVGLITE
jgi:hypothetical protein